MLRCINRPGGGTKVDSLANFRRELAERFRRDERLSDTLRSALVWACLTPRPPHTKHRLAFKAGISDATLWRHVRRSFPNGPDLHDLLQFLCLVTDLQAHFAQANPGTNGRLVKKRALTIFGVIPLDETEAVVLARRWVEEQLR